MPMNLTTPVALTTTVDNLKINSFSVDLGLKEIHVAYSEMSGLTVLAEKVITIVEPEFTATITDASTTAGADIYTPLKASLYSQIQAATSTTGIVV